MTKCDFKLLMLTNPKVVRSALLTDHNIKLVKEVKEAGVITAAKLADKRGISIQGASRQLGRLHAKGYLGRKQVVDPTGGFYYEYRYDLLDHDWEQTNA